MKKTPALAILIATLSTACKKNGSTKTESKTDILVKSAWTIDSYGVGVNMDMQLTGSENETLACTKSIASANA